MKTHYLMPLLLTAGAFLLSSCYSLRAVKWWQPDLQDVEKFGSTRIMRSESPFTFKFLNDPDKYGQLRREIDSTLQGTNTNAFVVIKNDTVIYEHYEANNRMALHPSFSVAKSFIGTLVGIAVDKGIISSVNDPVTKYLPQLAKNDSRFTQLTIQHLLDMRSGIKFDENKETPFAEITKLYYGRSLKRQVNRLKLKADPGKAFEYQSVNTQVLAAVLEQASGKPVQDLLKEYLWQPLGMESDALWSMDDKHEVKAFCCLNATALDFAKLGRLYLQKGNWEGRQIVSERWITTTTHPDTLYKRGYKNQWWACADNRYFKDSTSAVEFLRTSNVKSYLRKTNTGYYYTSLKAADYKAEGILGQIVYVNPATKVIIVRLGTYPNRNIYFNGLIPQLGRML